jgi:hypothetical protein
MTPGQNSINTSHRIGLLTLHHVNSTRFIGGSLYIDPSKSVSLTSHSSYLLSPPLVYFHFITRDPRYLEPFSVLPNPFGMEIDERSAPYNRVGHTPRLRRRSPLACLPACLSACPPKLFVFAETHIPPLP